MKLKDIPGVMLGEKEIQGKCETWESDGYGKYYNQALTAQGDVEVELDLDKTTEIIAQNIPFVSVGREDIRRTIAQTLSDNLPSILKVKK